MRFHFVINPHAGRGRTAEVLAAIDRHFRPEEVRVHLGSLPATWEASDRVVAVGGDGTVHRVVNAVAGSGCVVGILPTGTSNDLARELGIPSDLDEACRLLRDGATTRIDLVQVNRTLVATAGGLGVPASIAYRANRWKSGEGVGRLMARGLGRGIYVAAAIVELAGRWRPVFGALGEDGPREQWAALLVSNQSHLGPFSASPGARNRDGRLDVCRIDAPRPAIRMLWIALRMLRARGGRCPEVRGFRTRSLVLECSEPQPFLADGEILEPARRFEIRIQPLALEVVVPGPGRRVPRRAPRLLPVSYLRRRILTGGEASRPSRPFGFSGSLQPASPRRPRTRVE